MNEFWTRCKQGTNRRKWTFKTRSRQQLHLDGFVKASPSSEDDGELTCDIDIDILHRNGH